MLCKGACPSGDLVTSHFAQYNRRSGRKRETVGTSGEDIQEALKDLLGGTLKEMLEAEMDSHLGYSKSERFDSDDYRNGYKPKRINSSYGSMDIKVPKAVRKGESFAAFVHVQSGMSSGEVAYIWGELPNDLDSPDEVMGQILTVTDAKSKSRGDACRGRKYGQADRQPTNHLSSSPTGREPGPDAWLVSVHQRRGYAQGAGDYICRRGRDAGDRSSLPAGGNSPSSTSPSSRKANSGRPQAQGETTLRWATEASGLCPG